MVAPFAVTVTALQYLSSPVIRRSTQATMTTTLTLVSLLGSSPSSAFALAYALPLLFLSILLTFAGTFLTLDRTRSFPHPSYKAIPGSLDAPKRRIAFALEGGVGGLAIGYSFGGTIADIRDG